ncbi:MAG: adenylosuccinate lyase, partial [Chloroflexota bacterium]
SRVLVALVDHGGMGREDAYAVVQRAALAAADERRPLFDLLLAEPAVMDHLGAAGLASCFDDDVHLSHVAEVIARLDAIALAEPTP